MARPEGLEPSTREVEARCSDPLSYGRRRVGRSTLSYSLSRGCLEPSRIAGGALTRNLPYSFICAFGAGAAGPESNRQHRSYGLRALPFELQQRLGFVFASRKDST